MGFWNCTIQFKGRKLGQVRGRENSMNVMTDSRMTGAHERQRVKVCLKKKQRVREMSSRYETR